MNQSNVEHISDHDVYLVFKGAFLYLSPLTIPLGLIVITQNVVIFLNYYKDRNKLIRSLFMGIAMSDILRAQGELVLSVISILAYTGLVEVTVLYKSLVYYMLTALPGANWSKVFNLAMTISITIKVVNPFDRIDSNRFMGVVTCCCITIAMLHLSDVIMVIEETPKLNFYDPSIGRAYLYLFFVFSFVVPGGLTTVILYCMRDESGKSRCDRDYMHTGNNKEIFDNLQYSMAAVYFLVPPLVVLICMVIQVMYLRRSLPEEESKAASLMPNTARNASITVISVSLLFFICNTLYVCLIVGFWLYYNAHHWDKESHSDNVITDWGVGLGLSEFTLPLMYAVFYPVILICRKEELRRRYVNYWRKVTSWCRSRGEGEL